MSIILQYLFRASPWLFWLSSVYSLPPKTPIHITFDTFPKIINASCNTLARNISIGFWCLQEICGLYSDNQSSVCPGLTAIYLQVFPLTEVPFSTSSLLQWSWSWNWLMFTLGPKTPPPSTHPLSHGSGPVSCHKMFQEILYPTLTMHRLQYLYKSLILTLNHKSFFFLSFQSDYNFFEVCVFLVYSQVSIHLKYIYWGPTFVPCTVSGWGGLLCFNIVNR